MSTQTSRSRRRRFRPFSRLLRHHPNAQTERGYVMVTTALVLLPLLAVASFAVDLGGFYTRAAKLQRAAEAASLAGVVWMPDLATARTVAVAAAAANGVVASSTLTIVVNPVSGNPHQLTVTITDLSVPQYISKFFDPNVTISRTAASEYEQPIPMGSPMNYFGTGNLNTGSPPAENMWAAVNGYCAAKENGDPRLAGFDNALGSSGYECNTSYGAIVNPDADPAGYLYSIEIPSVAPASLDVQVYDAAFDGSSSIDRRLMSGHSTDTTYRILDAAGAPYQPISHAVLTTTVATGNDAVWRSTWRSVGTITNPCAGCTYYLQVYTSVQTNSAVANAYAVRTAPNGTFSACSTVSGSTNPAYSANCARIYPYSEVGVFANLSGSVATFYLAEIDSAYAGKTIDIHLFDLGEGASKVEILDPNGSPVTFDWSTPCDPPTAMAAGCSGTGLTSLNPMPSGTQPYPRLSSTSIFNDRTITLRTVMPANYTGAYGTNTWWKVRYTVGTSATDRTTWSVGVEGSPVHLTI